MVLLHGFPQDETSYREVVGPLNAQGLRTLVPTQRGYARTARPIDRRDYRMSELADDVIGLIEASGSDQVHLVGHDWGGAVAWAVAGRHPDRVRSLTVLSTPHPAAMTEAMLHSSQALKSWYMAFFQLPVLPEMALSQGFARRLRRSGLPAEAAEHYAMVMHDRARLTGALNWYRGLPFSMGATVPDAAVPTTFIWGRQDFALGRAAAVRTGAHVTADYRFLELDSGHWLPELCPDDVAGAILDRVSGSS